MPLSYRLLSEYLGTKTMQAVVCKTFAGVKAMESYDKDGSINKILGIHGLASSIGETVDGRYDVICLENITYVVYCLHLLLNLFLLFLNL